MLTNLSIKNYALIEHLDVAFQDGFTTITGETGAGKSILLGALGLVLGKRADTTHLNNKDKKCIIEATFSIANYKLQSFFEAEDVDYEATTILRREILPSGKSRAFINDTPTTLSVLSSLSKHLIDIHSQHQTVQIGDGQFHFNLLDALAGNKSKIVSYQTTLKNYKKEKLALKVLLNTQKQSKEQYEYHLHLYTELETANLVVGEQKDLEQQLEVLNNVELIQSNISEAIATANVEEVGLQSLLQRFKTNVARIASFSSKYDTLSERIESAAIEFRDIVSDLESLSEDISINPQEIQKLNDRLQLLLSLQTKHSVATILELLEKKVYLEVKINEVTNASEMIATVQEKLDGFKKELQNLAQNISENRKHIIPKLEKELQENFQLLEMSHAKCTFELSPSEEFLTNGSDVLDVLFTANKGSEMKPLKKVASGGELSRIMLAIKNVLSTYSNLPTIIFDEIDTGVSGEISKSIAQIMKTMSANMQVITITHLPQVAAIGKQHYKVFKENTNEKTTTNIEVLSSANRIEEIASMLGGNKLSTAAISHAKELLNIT